MKKILSTKKMGHCTNNSMLVDKDEVGRRLDNYLLSRIKAPRPLLHRLIRKGAIRVNGKRVKHDYRVLHEDRIKLPHIDPTVAEDRVVSKDLLNSIKNRILFEDSDVLVIDKPVSLASQPGSGIAFSAIDVAKKLLHASSPDIGLAHRIDRQTSGCLVFGKHKKALITLQEAFRDRAVNKSYLAILDNPDALPIHHMNDPILVVGDGPGQSKLAMVGSSGKSAFTDFQALYHANGLSLVLAIPETGRMHQIRVHAQAMGCPILGDKKYNKCSKKQPSRLFLHAYCISFKHPSSLEGIRVEAPVPTDFAAALGLSMEALLAQIEGHGASHSA